MYIYLFILAGRGGLWRTLADLYIEREKYIYIYIYIYRDVLYACMCVYVYVCVHTYTFTHVIPSHRATGIVCPSCRFGTNMFGRGVQHRQITQLTSDGKVLFFVACIPSTVISLR